MSVLSNLCWVFSFSFPSSPPPFLRAGGGRSVLDQVLAEVVYVVGFEEGFRKILRQMQASFS